MIGDIILKLEGDDLDNASTLNDECHGIEDQIRILAIKAHKMKQQLWVIVDEVAQRQGIQIDRKTRSYRINTTTGEVKDAGPIGYDFWTKKEGQ